MLRTVSCRVVSCRVILYMHPFILTHPTGAKWHMHIFKLEPGRNLQLDGSHGGLFELVFLIGIKSGITQEDCYMKRVSVNFGRYVILKKTMKLNV